MMRFAIAFILAAFVSGVGLRLHALSFTGALAAACVGVVAFTWGDIRWYGPLLIFFFTGSFLFRLFGRTDRVVQEQMRPRTWKQVCASGGTLPLFLAGAYAMPSYASLFLGAYIALLAAQTADTWATESGTRWGGIPRDILTRKPLVPGESGGVTAVGTFFGVLGSVVLVGSFFLFDFLRTSLGLWSTRNPDLSYLPIPVSFFLLVGIGIVGLFGDSFLGAIWERTDAKRGTPFLSNEGVNFLSGHLAAVLYMGIVQGIICAS